MNHNFDRAARAYVVLDAYNDYTAPSDDDVNGIIIRLLADLRHYCDYTATNFPECMLCSNEQYLHDRDLQGLKQEL